MSATILFKIKYKFITFLQSIIRLIVISAWTRNLLNLFYLQLNAQQKSIFYVWFSKVFRDTDICIDEGSWEVYFAEQKILIPLTSDWLWLDWDNAISIVGHDIDIKETYEAILNSSVNKPDCFIDIGANYGTHSLLFLMKGINTITFEPNRLCHDYFQQICDHNHVKPTLEKIALGEQNGYVDLVYPQKNTWNGSTNIDIIPSLRDQFTVSQDLVIEKVIQIKLDDYYSKITNQKTLIKIDTEGNELSVLMGGKKILKEIQPTIIFECMAKPNIRTKIFEFFLSEDYQVYELPWNPNYPRYPITYEQFSQDLSTNFIAISKFSTSHCKDLRS